MTSAAQTSAQSFSAQNLIDCTLNGTDTCSQGGEMHDGVLQVCRYAVVQWNRVVIGGGIIVTKRVNAPPSNACPSLTQTE